MIRWNKLKNLGGFSVVRFSGENGEEVRSLDPENLTVYSRQLGPGNTIIKVIHRTLADPALIGDWVVKCNSTGFTFFLPDQVFRKLFQH